MSIYEDSRIFILKDLCDKWAQVYYGWLTGNTDMKDLIFEKAQK